MKDYHQILEVPPNTTEEQLRAQYRRLARIYHPDRFNNPQDKEYVEQKFKEISEAYQILLSRLKGAGSVVQSSLGNPTDTIPPKPVAIPSTLDFGEIVKGEQRTLRFQVHNDGGLAHNLQLNYSDEHHWFKVMNGRKVHQSRPFPMEFTVVVDTSRLQAGKTYHGWIQVEIDNTFIQLTLAAKVSPRRIWNMLTPRSALVLSLFLLALLITQRQWSNLGLPIFSQSLKPLPTVQVSVYSTTPVNLNNDPSEISSENSISLNSAIVSSTTTVHGIDSVSQDNKESTPIVSPPIVSTVTATPTVLFSTLLTDTSLITDTSGISVSTNSVFAVGSSLTATVQSQGSSAEILDINGRTKAQASATAEFLIPPVESMRLTVTSSLIDNLDAQKELEGLPNAIREDGRNNDLRPAVEAAEFDTAENIASVTAAATREPTATHTPRPTTTMTSTPAPTASATATREPTATHTPRPTTTMTSTPAPTASATATREPTVTYTPRPTMTATSMPAPTASATATREPTATYTPRPTMTATSMPAPTASATATREPTATQTPRSTTTMTSTPTSVASITMTVTREPRPTPTVAVIDVTPSDELAVATVVIPDTYNVNARSQTSVASDVLAVLQSGTEWTAIGRTIDNAWLLILLDNGRYAWVFTTTVIVDAEQVSQLRITNTIPNS